MNSYQQRKLAKKAAARLTQYIADELCNDKDIIEAEYQIAQQEELLRNAKFVQQSAIITKMRNKNLS